MNALVMCENERSRRVRKHPTASNRPARLTRTEGSMEPTHDWRPAMYGSVTGSGRRRPPSMKVKAALIVLHGENCTYCTLPTTASILYRGKMIALRQAWDHFRPFAYTQSNAMDNWRLSCHVCNGIKTDINYACVEDAAEAILRRRERKGYEPVAEAWHRLLAEPYCPYQPPRRNQTTEGRTEAPRPLPGAPRLGQPVDIGTKGSS